MLVELTSNEELNHTKRGTYYNLWTCITLGILAFFGNYIYLFWDSHKWLVFLIIVIMIVYTIARTIYFFPWLESYFCFYCDSTRDDGYEDETVHNTDENQNISTNTA